MVTKATRDDIIRVDDLQSTITLELTEITVLDDQLSMDVSVSNSPDFQGGVHVGGVLVLTVEGRPRDMVAVDLAPGESTTGELKHRERGIEGSRWEVDIEREMLDLEVKGLITQANDVRIVS